jgi:integrase
MLSFSDLFQKFLRKLKFGQSEAYRDTYKNGNMLLFQVKEFTSRSGDEIVLLLDRQDGPTFWPNVFVTSQYVVAGRAADTRKKVLRSIGMARMWAASLSRNLDDELSFGPFLSTQDVPSLADFLGLNAATQESRFTENRAVAESSGTARRLEDLRPDRRRLLGTREKAAHPDEVGNRIRWVAEYVDWHLCRRLGDMQHSGQDAYALREHGLEVLSLLRQRIPSNSARHDEIALEGISEEAEAALEATLHPASDQNPFRSAFVRARNYLAWRLYKDTGSRRSEVRNAHADDIAYATRRFWIRESKTTPRETVIGEITAEAFDDFMTEHWGNLPREARRRGYLFTDKNGTRLSARAFNRIFEAARAIVPAIPDCTSPHTIRRTWNDRFSETIDSLPADKKPPEEREIQMRNRLQGWSPNSKMGALYARRHTRRKADEIAERLVENFDIKIGRDDG